MVGNSILNPLKPQTTAGTYYQQLPKVDLHRHLEGSLRLRTLLEEGRSHGLSLPNTNRLRELVQIGEEEPFTFENFLSKFQTLRLFYRSPEIIARLTREALEDAAADNVRYLELRFTPVALGRAEGFPLDQVVSWVIKGSQEAEKEFGVKTRLIVSVNRHEDPELAAQVVRVAVDHMQDGIVGLDLAGDEAGFSGLLFSGVFKEARQAGLNITVHAGEWGEPLTFEKPLSIWVPSALDMACGYWKIPVLRHWRKNAKPLSKYALPAIISPGLCQPLAYTLFRGCSL